MLKVSEREYSKKNRNKKNIIQSVFGFITFEAKL